MATFKGIITAALPVASGVSGSGREWRRASFVLTYDNLNGQYPRSILFDVMGDRIEQLNLQQGCEYEVEVDFSTREYNGRTYMSATAWKATALGQVPGNCPPQAPGVQPVSAGDVPGVDLPF